MSSMKSGICCCVKFKEFAVAGNGYQLRARGCTPPMPSTSNSTRWWVRDCRLFHVWFCCCCHIAANSWLGVSHGDSLRVILRFLRFSWTDVYYFLLQMSIKPQPFATGFMLFFHLNVLQALRDEDREKVLVVTFWSDMLNFLSNKYIRWMIDRSAILYHEAEKYYSYLRILFEACARPILGGKSLKKYDRSDVACLIGKVSQQ